MKILRILLLVGFIVRSEPIFSQASFTIVSGICLNESYPLAGSTGTWTNCTYTWSASPAGAFFSTANNLNTLIMLTGPGTYTIDLTILSGTQTSSFQNTVTALPLPTISLAQNGFTTCITNNFPLSSKPIVLSASGGVSYTWAPAPTSTIGNPNSSSYTVSPATSTCFTVTGVNADGCTAMASACTTVVPRFGISAQPVDTLVCKTLNNTGVAILRARLPVPPWIGSESSLTYSWSPTSAGMLTSPSSKTVAVSPAATSVYTLEMRDSINCVSIPATATVNVDICTGIQDIDLRGLEIYPNPVSNKLTIKNESDVPFKKIEILDGTGRVVFVVTKFEDPEMNLAFLAKGLYYLRIEREGRPITFKLIKE